MSLFPAIQPPQETAGDQDLPLAREVGWDFQRDIPLFRRGEPVIVTGAEAVKVWAWKALHTPRYRFEIYSWAYGAEFAALIGDAYTERLKTAEAPRYLRECLLINPYITAVRNISVSFAGDRLTVSARVETVYGEVPVDAVI